MNDTELIRSSNKLLGLLLGIFGLVAMVGIMVISKKGNDPRVYEDMGKLMIENRTLRRGFSIDCSSRLMAYQSLSRDTIESTIRGCINAADSKFPEKDWLSLAKAQEKARD